MSQAFNYDQTMEDLRKELRRGILEAYDLIEIYGVEDAVILLNGPTDINRPRQRDHHKRVQDLYKKLGLSIEELQEISDEILAEVMSSLPKNPPS